MVTSDFNLQKLDTEGYAKSIRFAIDSGASIAAFGRRGSGKTQIAKEEIKAANCKEVYLNLSVLERPDLGGYPNLLNPTGSFVDFRLPESFRAMIEGNEPVVALLDEVDKAEPSLWAPLLEFTQFHTINGRALKNLKAVIMTGNLISEGGNKPCLPLLDRASKFLIEPDVGKWMEWAGKSGKIHGSVTAYIHDNPADLYGEVDPDSSYADPSPRSWENASKALFIAEKAKFDAETTYRMVAGCVGNATGLKYRAYFEHYQKILPLVEELFAGKDIKKKFQDLKTTEQLVISMIVCSRLSAVLDANESAIKDQKGKKTLPKVVDDALTNSSKLLLEISQEYCLISVRSQLKIERIINFSLDDHPDFGKTLARVRQKINNR